MGFYIEELGQGWATEKVSKSVKFPVHPLQAAAIRQCQARLHSSEAIAKPKTLLSLPWYLPARLYRPGGTSKDVRQGIYGGYELSSVL